PLPSTGDSGARTAWVWMKSSRSSARRTHSGENRRDDAFLARCQCLGGRHVSFEDRRKRVTVGNAVKAQCADRHVQIGWIDVLPKYTQLFSALDDSPNSVDSRDVECWYVGRPG